MQDNKKNAIITIVTIIVAITILIMFLISNKDENTKVEETMLGINYDIEGNESPLSKYVTENPVVAMYIKNYGSIVIELYPSVAENTVSNFISLIKEGFYDNNTMHRLVPGFVLQGGDPTGSGTGGPGYHIKGEFSSNNYNNNLKHTEGIISMARSQNYDSAGSQFFIMLGTAPELDGNYAAFGKVIDGWKNIERIEKNEKILNQESGKLVNNLTIKKVIIDLKGKTYKEVEKTIIK